MSIVSLVTSNYIGWRCKDVKMVISIFEITSCGFLHQCYKTNLAKLIKKKTGLINRESNSWVTVGGGRIEIT